MATLTAQDISDIVASTQYELGPMKFQQIAQNLTQYEVFSKWFKRDKVTFDSGIGIQRTLMNRLSSSARHVGLLEPDTTNIENVVAQLQVPWRRATTNWALIYQTDILMNSGKALIFKVIKPRRAACMINLVEEFENKALGAAPASTNKTDPWGLLYWVVKNATTGFNGGAAAGNTTVGGVDLTSTPTFKNYTGQYVSHTKADLIKKLRTMHRKIRFVSPVTIDDYRGAMGEQYRLYCNETSISAFEDIGEGQNENLGRDVASMDGQIVFRKHPIIWMQKLDDDTSNPIYMIDHSTFYPVALKGDWLRESEATRVADNHNVFRIDVDCSYNYLCLDRRRNGVVYI